MSLQLPSEIAHSQQFSSNSRQPSRQRQAWKGVGSVHYYRNGTTKIIPKHSHSSHSLLISLSGTTWLNMPSNGYHQLQKLSVGGIAITPATVMHSALLEEGAEFIILHLNPEFVLRSAYGQARHQSTLKPLLLQTDPLIQSIATTLKTEIELAQRSRWSCLQRTVESARCDRLYTESLCSTLSAHLLKRYTTDSQSLQACSSRLSSQKLSDAIDYIDAHLGNAVRLEDIADVLSISRYHFCHLFKQSFGITPYQYILQQRVERAKQLLRWQELTLVEVALACGFANQSHFTKHFRQQTGSTPKRYRQVQKSPSRVDREIA